MKTLNESFTDEEWKILSTAKGKLTWSKFLLFVAESVNAFPTEIEYKDYDAEENPFFDGESYNVALSDWVNNFKRHIDPDDIDAVFKQVVKAKLCLETRKKAKSE